MSANISPPIPVDIGSTTFKTAAAQIAASTALPPSCKTRTAAAEASGWLVAAKPFMARTGDRLPCALEAGRSPWFIFVLQSEKVFEGVNIHENAGRVHRHLDDPARIFVNNDINTLSCTQAKDFLKDRGAKQDRMTATPPKRRQDYAIWAYFPHQRTDSLRFNQRMINQEQQRTRCARR